MTTFDLLGRRFPNGQVVLEEDQAEALWSYLTTSQELLKDAIGLGDQDLDTEITRILFDE